MTHFLEAAIRQGRIKADKVKEITDKEDKQKKAKESVKGDLNKKSKAELIAIIEDLK